MCVAVDRFCWCFVSIARFSAAHTTTTRKSHLQPLLIFQSPLFLSLARSLPAIRNDALQYLDFDNLPETNFTCAGKVIGGYYADLETSCQMFHVCTIGQLDEPMDIKFLCLNGTVFDQETRVCERVDEVDCTKSERFYYLNLELYGNTMLPLSEGNFRPFSPLDLFMLNVLQLVLNHYCFSNLDQMNHPARRIVSQRRLASRPPFRRQR